MSPQERAYIEAKNALIIAEAALLERIDYTDTRGVSGFYIYNRKTGRVAMHKIKVYDARALFGYDWKDANGETTV